MPISLSPDMAGEYARDLFVVLAVSLLLSWILALVHVPIHSNSYLKLNVKETSEEVFNSPLYKKFRSMLMVFLRHRLITLSCVVGVLLVSVACFQLLPQTFFP